MPFTPPALHVSAIGSAQADPVRQRVAPPVAPRAGQGHVPALDGLRGMAVLMVFLYHYGGGRHSSHALLRGIGFACNLGWAGVTLFFVLSGFLITGILWDARGERHWFRNFYVRRALRILPLYYGTLVLLLLWPVFDHQYSFRAVGQVVAIHALYLQNLPLYNFLWKLVPLPLWLEHYWTLAVEEQFYLLWPLLLYLARSRRVAVALCGSVFLLSTIFNFHNQITAANPAAYWHSLQGHAGELAIGGALALLRRGHHWPLVRRGVLLAGAVCAVIFIGGTVWLRSSTGEVFFVNTWGLTALTLAFTGLLAALLEPNPLQRIASAGWLRWLGRISFGVYVFHLLPVFQYNRLASMLTGQSDGNVFNLVRLLVVASLSLALASLSFRLYESRFLRLKSRLAPHRR